MPVIHVRETESNESAMRRFKRAVEKSGKPKEIRKKEFYQKRSTLRKRAKAAARKRYLKKLSREQMVQGGASPLARRPLRPVRKPAPFGATRPAYGARDENKDAVPYGR